MDDYRRPFADDQALSRLAPRVIGGGLGGVGSYGTGLSGVGGGIRPVSPAPSALSVAPSPGSYSASYAPPVGTPGPLSRSYVPPAAPQARGGYDRPDALYAGVDRRRDGVSDFREKGAFSSYPSFVAPAPSGGVIVDGHRQVDQPGEAWETGGYRYRLGDRYQLDGEGHAQSRSPGAGSFPSAGYGKGSGRSVPAHRGAGAGYPPYGSGYPDQRYWEYPASGAYGAGYPGAADAYGQYDHMHDSYPAHLLPPHHQHDGPMPPPSAPGTPANLPYYMQGEEGSRKGKKKDKKKDGKRSKKNVGCC